MSARTQPLAPCRRGDSRCADETSDEKRIMRDEEKSKEQLIDELFELRQRIAELEDVQEKRLDFVQGEIDFVKRLPEPLRNAKTLTGLLPICSSCKKIRDGQGYWNQLEIYIREHTEAEFTHGLCPECVKKLYPVDILTSNNSQKNSR